MNSIPTLSAPLRGCMMWKSALNKPSDLNDYRTRSRVQVVDKVCRFNMRPQFVPAHCKLRAALKRIEDMTEHFPNIHARATSVPPKTINADPMMS